MNETYIKMAESIGSLSRSISRKNYTQAYDLVDSWDEWKETISRNYAGDCDDYSIMIFDTLLFWGIPKDQLRMGVMKKYGNVWLLDTSFDDDKTSWDHAHNFKESTCDSAHMLVLLYDEGDDPYIIDSTGAISNKLIKLSEIGW